MSGPEKSNTTRHFLFQIRLSGNAEAQPIHVAQERVGGGGGDGEVVVSRDRAMGDRVGSIPAAHQDLFLMLVTLDNSVAQT